MIPKFFSLRYFMHFLLRHFVHWNISTICFTVVLKLTITMFINLYFQSSDQNELIFSVISETIQPLTKEKKSYDKLLNDKGLATQQKKLF